MEKGLKNSGPRVSGGFMAHVGKTSEGFQTRMVAVGERPLIQKCEFPSKKLSESTWQACRTKGLCFKYDEKFTIGH